MAIVQRDMIKVIDRATLCMARYTEWKHVQYEFESEPIETTQFQCVHKYLVGILGNIYLKCIEIRIAAIFNNTIWIYCTALARLKDAQKISQGIIK